MLMIFSRPDIFGQKSWGSFGPYFRNPHRAPNFAGSALALGGSHARCTDLADTSRQYWEDHMHDMSNPETDNLAAYWCAIAKPCTVDHRESLHCGPSDWSIQLLKFCHADLKVSMSNMSRQITMIQRLLLSDIGTLYRKSIDIYIN
jgi:hypothetical protein